MAKSKAPPQREVTRERELRAWKLRQQLWTHERIAADLGVERSTVTKMLMRTSQRYLDSVQGEVAALKGEQLTQLEHIADEAMQAWRASKQPRKEARKVTRKQSKRGDEEATSAQTKEQNGDWHHLEMARGALGDIRKLMGLDAPTKIAPTTPDGESVYSAIAGIAKLNDADLDQLIRNLEAAIRLGAVGAPQPGSAADGAPGVDTTTQADADAGQTV